MDKFVEREILLWETKFFAISTTTGKVELFKGMFIEAINLQEAFQIGRDLKLDYLQFTGRWFKNFDVVNMNEDFYKVLNSPREHLIAMDYDEVQTWLDNALSEGDLQVAMEKLYKNNLEEYVKLVEIYRKNKYDKKKNEEKEDDNSEEEDGKEGSPV